MFINLRLLSGIFVFLSSLQIFQVKGQCVDQPEFIQNGKTCVQLVPLGCYDILILNKCCHSCTASSTGVTGCEYGDKVANCIDVLCPHYTDPNECCNTCKVTTAVPTSSLSTTTTSKTGPPQTSLEITAETTKIATNKIFTSTISSLHVPAAPSVSIVSQTIKNITLNVTIQPGSTANEFDVMTTDGLPQKIPLPGGKLSLDYIYSAPNNAGTCFTLEVVAINTAGRSAVTTVSNACYAPKNPEVTLVTQSISNVTLNITLPEASLGSLFEVKAIRRGMSHNVSYPSDGSRSVQYVFNETAEAGTCFSLEIANLVINNPIKSDETIVKSVCYAPKSPEVTLVTQSTSNVTLNITLPEASLGSLFEVKAIRRRMAHSVSLPLDGSRSVQYVFNETAEAGTCFNLEINNLVLNNPVKSDETIVKIVCYVPKKPEVTLVSQSTSNVTLNITLPEASLGSLFEVKIIRRGMTRTVSLPLDASRSVQYVFNEKAEAGTCFSLEIANLVLNNPVKSDETIVKSVCYVPLEPTASIFEQTVNCITFNISLQAGSTGKSFNVNVIGGKEYVVAIQESSTDVKFVFNETGTPGTCFTLQFRTLSINNLTHSKATSIPNTCYASFPVTRELPSTGEQTKVTVVAVSCVGSLIILCGAAAILFITVRKRRRSLWVVNQFAVQQKNADSRPRQHENQ
ncbi:hypothetical protein CHS0354_005413 [Potamilus streckersoni]|uniref:Uncharacterized protein n=1 Tax=Potamilus streckersoni TaxID=2493646 RepID=A0AAE0T6C5_9BIVA|nr:hypothetical protein CHS0354_005413 [Potamilus streckersoni]